jgi:hypothetical protein
MVSPGHLNYLPAQNDLRYSMGKIQLFVLLLLAISCSSPHDSETRERQARHEILACLDKKLEQLKTTHPYKEVFRLAEEFYEASKDTLEIFTQVKVPVKRILDPHIFFNEDSTYCVLILLQQYPADFESGYTRIIIGRKNNGWSFGVGMEMSFSEDDIESLYPDEYKKGVRRYSLEMLSQRARISVLNLNTEPLKGCDLDDTWWLKNQVFAGKDMNMEKFVAPEFFEKVFIEKYARKDKENNAYVFSFERIGTLDLPTGKIIACDPFASPESSPFSITFPKGNFPVELPLAKSGDDERVAFARIKFSEETPVYWSMAVSEGEDISTLEEDEIFGYGVDSGTGGFLDSSFAKEYSTYLCPGGNFDKLSADMDKTHKHTRSWIIWGDDKKKVALFSSGWGDGLYASYIGYDSNNKICRLVTDFGMIDWLGK